MKPSSGGTDPAPATGVKGCIVGSSGPDQQTDASVTGAYEPLGPSREKAGDQIGPYTLLEVLGQGGMGAVWLAEQNEPVRRQVALKVIKSGMDSDSIVARFEAERQALALMDHPNIAKVFDGGTTAAGRPYFVMELVQGAPITWYCDREKLTVRQRFELMIPVCQAVQHAHQKGIIHRDLKPSNILVGTYDGRPVPKVIDFGTAKATGPMLAAETMHTAADFIVGTLEYMAPEQAEVTNLDIDTRADIYSLGVVLYELVTGSPPLNRKLLRAAALDEMLRMIREVEPSKPSTKLSSANELPSLAAIRGMEPKRLTKFIRGDLDWIVMKCLEKERSRRYETANGLASDIQRYLADEPVSAGPPGANYRVRKFVRRNRGMVAAGAAVAAVLLVGIVGFAWQAKIARDQRDRAVTAEDQARKRADELQKVADFQGQMLKQVDPATAGARLSEDIRTRLDTALAKSGANADERRVRADSFAGLWSQVNATDTALDLIDRTILKPAVAAIDKQFVDQPIVAATLRHVLAERYHDLGLDNPALALEQRVLTERRRVLGEEHPDTLLSIGNVGAYLSGLGRKNDAEPYYREALEKSRRVRGNDSPETLVCVANMASFLLENGRLKDAEPFFHEALERRRSVLGEDHPETLRSTNDWASLLREQGKLDEAEEYCREALNGRRRVLGEEHRDTLGSTNDLAVLLKAQGKLDEAIKHFRHLVETRRRTLGEVHPRTLSSIQNLGAALDSSGNSVEAEALMREALAKQRQLLGADHTSTLATLGNLAVFLIGQNKLKEAEPMCRETLERRRNILGPNHTTTLIANNVMGLVLIRQEKLAEGEPYWREALAIARQVLGPADPETLVYMHNLASLAVDQDKPAEADRLYREVIEAGGPAVGAGHPTVLSATRRLAGMMLDQNRNADAAELLSAAEPAARKSYTGSNERNLGAFLERLGRVRARQEQFAAAESNLLEAHAITAKTRGPVHADTRNCAKLLTEFYAAWEKAEPGKGHAAKVAEWKTKMEAIKPAPMPKSDGKK